MGKKVLTTTRFWEELKSIGIELPPDCIDAKIILHAAEPAIIECRLVVTQDGKPQLVDDELLTVEKRYRLVEETPE